MHIVTGLSKELLPPSGEGEPGERWGGRFSSWGVLLSCVEVDGGCSHCAVGGSLEGTDG